MSFLREANRQPMKFLAFCMNIDPHRCSSLEALLFPPLLSIPGAGKEMKENRRLELTRSIAATHYDLRRESTVSILLFYEHFERKHEMSEVYGLFENSKHSSNKHCVLLFKFVVQYSKVSNVCQMDAELMQGVLECKPTA